MTQKKPIEKTRFQFVAEYLGMKIKRTRPYSPWQNGKVERSHREDGKILYGRKIFRSEKELKTGVYVIFSVNWPSMVNLPIRQ